MAGLLTRQQRLALGKRRLATPEPIPIAITGWNTRDALTEMAPTDAITLDNWYPDFGGLSLRQGYASWATGIGSGAVSTLAEFNAGATRKLIAAGSGAFYDASAAGPVGAPLATGFSNSWWNYTAFNGRLFFCNGVDAPQVYDGTTFANANFTGPGSLNNLVSVTTFSNRLWFVEKNRQGVWYGPLLGISGALTFFDLSMLSELGGNLAAITSFSYDGGSGVFDFICFMMNSGETFVYQGTDPSLSTTFSLVGRYNLSPAFNPRAIVRYGGEAYVATFDDYVPLQQGLAALRVGSQAPRSKVSGAVQAAVAANSGANGWQGLYYKKGRRLLFNVPNLDGTFDQHVLNTQLNAWCRFRGMPAACFGTFNDNLFFGASSGGTVYQADIGNLDAGTQAIAARGQQAWNLLGSNERKLITNVRPIISAAGNVAFGFGVGFDYGDINVPTVATTSPPSSPWDVSPWDISPWSAEAGIDPSWHVAGGAGLAVSWQLAISARVAVKWLRTDIWGIPGTGL